jgi:hypothetical protein
MSPFFQSSDDGEHLSAMNIIILLNRVQHFWQKDNRMPGIIVVRLLGENCFGSNARAVSLDIRATLLT